VSIGSRVARPAQSNGRLGEPQSTSLRNSLEEIPGTGCFEEFVLPQIDDEPPPLQTENMKKRSPQLSGETGNGKPWSPAVPVPERAEPQYIFRPIEEWEGTVVQVDRKKFVALIDDLRNPQAPRRRAVFPIAEVDEPDLDLLAEGSVFYWSIGHRFDRDARRSLDTTIRFRRLPGWTRSEIERAELRAAEFDNMFPADE